MISKHHSLKAADNVLTALRRLDTPGADHPPLKVMVQCYANGREEGYSLYSLRSPDDGFRQIAVAQYRNSDNIVVYFGTILDFYMAGNIPSDKIYKAARFFKYNESMLAAKFILEYFTNTGEFSDAK